MLEYNVSLDWKSKLVTSLCFLILAYLLSEIFFELTIPKSKFHSLYIATSVLIGLIIILFFMSIHSYVLTQEAVLLKRRLGFLHVKMKFDAISDVRLLESHDLKGLIRTFGNGGIFGYSGFYYNERLGKVRFYGGNTKNLVLITLKDARKIVVTPDHKEFVLELQKKLQ